MLNSRFMKLAKLFTLLALPLFAATTDSVDIHMTIEDIRELSFDTDYIDINITSSTGGEIDPVTVTSSYNVTSTTNTNMEIMAKVDVDPTLSDVILQYFLEAPPGGASVGAVSLSTTYQDLVTGVFGAASSNLAQHVTIRQDHPTAVPVEGSYVFNVDILIAEN
ncbi:MAG: hypothetical protein MRY21_02855 [Simkaniaceae bacterium]|nr:hypothetical protein [Simkaniaceae bacterium]